MTGRVNDPLLRRLGVLDLLPRAVFGLLAGALEALAFLFKGRAAGRFAVSGSEERTVSGSPVLPPRKSMPASS
jgi:hypothetical protein